MKKKNDNIKSIVVLGTICLVIAVLMAAVNNVTAPIIEENAASAATGSLKIVLPDATDFEEVTLPADAPETVTALYKDNGGSGYAVTLATTSSYSASPMTFTLGIGTDGKIVGVEMTNYAETKDFGDYPQSYVGADSALGGVDLFSGATYSSTAFKNAVSDAFTVLVSMGGVSEGEKSEEQLIEEAKLSALPGAVDRAGKIHLSEAAVADNSGLIREAYTADNGCGYIFVAEDGGETLVCAVSATGSTAILNLDAEDVSSAHTELSAALSAAADFSKNAEASLATATKAVDAGLTLTPVKAPAGALNGTITAAFITDGAAPQYVFVCQPYGYREPMKLVFVLDSTGTVANFRTASELIQDSEYFTDYQLDPDAYKAGIVGMSEATLNSDAMLISGATATTGGVTQAVNDVFAAYKAQWEAVQ